MKVLLDTHVLLWFQANDPALPMKARKIIESKGNDCVVSIVSLWEISIKHSIGKLPLRMPLSAFFNTISAADLRTLPLLREHLLELPELPHHHRDPFDRILIAQANYEGMHILTADKHFKAYDVKLVGG